MHLAHHRKTVALITGLVLRIAFRGRAEIGKLEIDAAERYAVSQHFQGTAFLDQGGQMPGQRGFLLAGKLFAELRPFPGLGGPDKGRGLFHIQQCRGIEGGIRTLTVKRALGESGDDSILGGLFRHTAGFEV